MKKSNKKYIEILWSFTRFQKVVHIPLAAFCIFFYHFFLIFLAKFQYFFSYQPRKLNKFHYEYNFLRFHRDRMHKIYYFFFSFSHSEVIQTGEIHSVHSFFLLKFQPTQRSSKIILKKLKSVLFCLAFHASVVLVVSYTFFLTVFLLLFPVKVYKL